MDIPGSCSGRRVGDASGIADTLLNVLLLLATIPAERQRAHTAGGESLLLFRERGEATGEALALSGLGLIASGAGNRYHAASLRAESLQPARCVEDLTTEARALGNLAVIELEREEFSHADDLLSRHLEAVNTLGDLDGVAFSLEALAGLYAACRDDERAADLYGATGAFRDRIALAMPPEPLQRHESVATRGSIGAGVSGRAGKERVTVQVLRFSFICCCSVLSDFSMAAPHSSASAVQ